MRLLRGREKWAQGEVIQRLGSGSNQQQGQPCPHQSPCGGHGRPHSATHSWQWPLPKPPLGPRVQMLRCITLHTPLTLPQRCCSLCQKPTPQGQRRFPAHLPKRGTSLRKGWPRQPQPRNRRGPAQDDATLPVLGSLPRDWISESTDCAGHRQG